MSNRPRFRASILIGCMAVAVGLSGSLMAADRAPPDFTPNPSAGWFAYSREWIAPNSGPGPVMQHPDHRRVSNDDYRVTGKQPTLPVADPDNPILQPWAREVLLKQNQLVRSGMPADTLHASCHPIGIRTEGIARRTNVANVAMLASAGVSPLLEAICAENPNAFAGFETRPIAQSVKPDF